MALQYHLSRSLLTERPSGVNWLSGTFLTKFAELPVRLRSAISMLLPIRQGVQQQPLTETQYLGSNSQEQPQQYHKIDMKLKSLMKASLELIEDPIKKAKLKRQFRKILQDQTLSREECERKIELGLIKVEQYSQKASSKQKAMLDAFTTLKLSRFGMTRDMPTEMRESYSGQETSTATAYSSAKKVADAAHQVGQMKTPKNFPAFELDCIVFSVLEEFHRWRLSAEALPLAKRIVEAVVVEKLLLQERGIQPHDAFIPSFGQHKNKYKHKELYQWPGHHPSIQGSSVSDPLTTTSPTATTSPVVVTGDGQALKLEAPKAPMVPAITMPAITMQEKRHALSQVVIENPGQVIGKAGSTDKESEAGKAGHKKMPAAVPA